MALQFGGSTITTPDQAKRQRAVAEALIARSGTPASNWGTGLADVASAITGTVLNNRASDAETAGATRAGGLFGGLNSGSSVDDIAALLANPDAAWANDAQSGVASALLGNQFQQTDPYRQLQMQKLQQDIAQGGSGGGETFFGNPIPIQTPDGLVYGQIGNQGGFKPIDIGEGNQFLAPVQQLNQGTQFTGVDRFGNPTGGTTPINNIGAAQDTALGTGLGGQALTTIDAGRNAIQNNAKLDILEQTLVGAPQGAQGGLVQMAGQLGVNLGGLDQVQAANALISQLVPLQRAPGSGTMSDQDLALYKASLPAIINQPEANQRIIATARALNDYTIAHAQIEQQLANRQITEEQAIAAKQAIPNPLANQSGQSSSGSDWTDLGEGIRIRPLGQ